jgi:hypothetical protein
MNAWIGLDSSARTPLTDELCHEYRKSLRTGGPLGPYPFNMTDMNKRLKKGSC